MRRLLAATCLTPIALGFAATQALAETVISTAVTTPVLTGTASDDIRITSTGSVKPASGAAVTINSNDSVRNEGTIQITGSNGSTGILAHPNLAGNITNTGTIAIDEAFTPTDTDNDGDLDGPFAQGSNRFGIHVLGGGTFTGNITNSGAITVEGNNSAAIAVDSALSGSISHTAGAIAVTGNDSFGIRTGSVSGNITLSGGSITAIGGNSVGVSVDGDVGGAFVIQNSISTTGYRDTTPPADTSKFDSDDLLQGGSAVVVGGNVAGGILLDARPADNDTNDTDEDDDGVADAQESTAAILTLGSAPALKIGSSTQDIVIGAVASSTDGHGLVIKGSVGGNGLYKGVSGTGLEIGGTGHAVTIAGGAAITGTVSANAVEANATALHLASGASVATINVGSGGSVLASGGGTASTGSAAILIESGATTNTIINGGTISAARSGAEGTASAIIDRSGTLSLIENSGRISVNDAAALGDKAVAFDLSANTTGATVRQLVVASGKTAPVIAGTMLFGSGNDTLDIADGTVTGAAKFGLGANQLSLSGDAVMNGAVTFGSGVDSVQLAGTAVLDGNIDFGGGADTLTLSGTSAYHGALANSAAVAVNVGAGATLNLANTGAVSLASLTTGAGSTIGVSLQADGITLYDVSGAATFGADTAVKVNLLSLGGVEGTYKIIQAGTLTGAGNLVANPADLPFLYDSSLITSTPGEVSLVVNLKSASELGLNASEGSILDAVIGSADSDSAVAGVFIGAEDSAALRAALQQMLPEHAGGAFENVTRGSRLTAGILLDPRPPVTDRDGWGLWAQQVAWGNSKSIGSTSSYDVTGWGASVGVERRLGGAGNIGASLAFLSGKDGKDDNELISNQYEGGVYWRGKFGRFQAFARGTFGHVNFDGTRVFSATVDGELVTREADGEWNGRVYSAAAGAAYELRTGRFTIRPSAVVEYYRLKEKGYTETGGGDAFNLTVDGRTSDETAATGMVALGYDLLSLDPNESWLRVELEGGRREILGGSLGTTTARFANGDPFTLTPEERTSGWRAGLRVAGGGSDLTVAGEVNGEEQQGHASIGGRIGVQLNF